ncbi:hypothetical protein BMJ19_36725 [Sinorhizobium medicae]|nr:hypothetical protein BMJ19_36725 [Sinorhizobium medicae]
MGFRHHLVEIVERAEHRIDVAIIRNVIAHVRLGRGEERREPDGIDTERGDMRKPPGNAAKVTHSVAVGVLERSRIDLIDDRSAPPVVIRFRWGRHAQVSVFGSAIQIYLHRRFE